MPLRPCLKGKASSTCQQQSRHLRDRNLLLNESQKLGEVRLEIFDRPGLKIVKFDKVNLLTIQPRDQESESGRADILKTVVLRSSFD